MQGNIRDDKVVDESAKCWWCISQAIIQCYDIPLLMLSFLILNWLTDVVLWLSLFHITMDLERTYLVFQLLTLLHCGLFVVRKICCWLYLYIWSYLHFRSFRMTPASISSPTAVFIFFAKNCYVPHICAGFPFRKFWKMFHTSISDMV